MTHGSGSRWEKASERRSDPRNATKVPPRRPANLIEQELSRKAAAPDLTDSIMSRLGYARVSRKQARQLAIAKFARRACGVMVAAIVLGMGFYLHSQSDLIRRPTGPTVPSALQHDFSRHGDTVQGLLQSIRRFAPEIPAVPPEPPPNSIDDLVIPAGQPDPDATAPFQWV